MEGQENLNNASPGNYRDISIWLDKYEDLFSNFDAANLKARALSNSFLAEIHKLVHAGEAGNIELKFNIMLDQPNAEAETFITENIHSYFARRAETARYDKRVILRRGWIYTILGFAINTILIALGQTWDTELAVKGVELMATPIGWFLVWNGLDLVFVQAKKEQPVIDFNQKMTTAKLTFISFAMPEMLEQPPFDVQQPTDEGLRLAS
jgi:hypothetical protein